MQATVINNPRTPLEQTNFRVLIELTGSGSAKDGPGLDLVMVLDVSGSMGIKGQAGQGEDVHGIYYQQTQHDRSPVCRQIQYRRDQGVPIAPDN